VLERLADRAQKLSATAEPHYLILRIGSQEFKSPRSGHSTRYAISLQRLTGLEKTWNRVSSNLSANDGISRNVSPAVLE